MSGKRIEAGLLERLDRALVERNVQEGFALLEAQTNFPALLAVQAPQRISLLLCLAQWVDLGYRDLPFFEQCCARFNRTDIANLKFLDALKLKLAGAFHHLATENVDECIPSLDVVLLAGDGILPLHLKFLAHFWKGRALRKKGEYEPALLHIIAAPRAPEPPDWLQAPKFMKAGCFSSGASGVTHRSCWMRPNTASSPRATRCRSAI